MEFLISHLPILIGVVVFLITLVNSVAIAKGNQIICLERRWFGKTMPDGRTVALWNEVGIQARILGPGFHLLIPFLYKTTKRPFTDIGDGQVGLVRAIAGAAMSSGQIMAKDVTCNLFQDGEAFIENGGEKGPQLAILPEGQYRINPYLFEIEIVSAVEISDSEVGCVESIAGKPVTRPGGNFGSPVECDNFQDAAAFIDAGGQKGPQICFLNPGTYRINLILFKVTIKPITVVPGGKIGLVECADGARIPEGRLLGKVVGGHNNFNDGEKFIEGGGEKGRQLQALMPGTYRINTMLFHVDVNTEWTKIGPDEIGIVTIKEGKPITDPSKIAADEIPLDKHNFFQEAAEFIAAGGQKGLQIPVLRAGHYAINPWFAQVDKVPMTVVEIGNCGVVTYYVGEEGEDTTKDDVNAKIVPNGKKGIWAEPLQPGKHPLNTKICKVDIVPTTQILLNWADNRSSAHKYDEELGTITLRTADAFNVSMDVSVIIHIAMANAPKVIANLGSLSNMISQVLEPAISSHFRNAAQYIKALDLYTERKELQDKAKEHIIDVLKEHHIDSKDTLIADVVLPAELTRTVTDRQLAEQEKKTFDQQKLAQDARRELENATAQADMQQSVVESERKVDIAKNTADGKIREAEGGKQANILNAEGEAKSVELRAEANAKATILNAAADSERIQKVGAAEAEIILAKGKSQAEAYKLEVDAMGQEIFGAIRVVNAVTSSNLKLIPDNLVIGSGSGGDGNMVGPLFGVALIEKLTGRPFSASELKTIAEAVEPSATDGGKKTKEDSES